MVTVVLCGVCALPSAAHGQTADTRTEPDEVDAYFVDSERSQKRGFAAMTRPEGMVEIGVGWLTLPRAEVCGVDEAGCRRGDTTPQVDAWQNFRLNVDFALGAGITVGLLPTTDTPRRDPEGLNREHTRGYFMIESMARYYFYVGERFESSAGLAGGLVVVRDSYTPQSDQEFATVGTGGVIVRTEGYSVGLATGMAFALAPQWSAGAGLRFGSWFLPDEPARSPFGGTGASLTGRNTVASIGFNVAYRSTL
jgi:hypothetical protein